MEITILGSGNGMPSLRRNPPGYLFKIKGKNLVFDPASCALQSLLKCNVDYNAIDYIFITHTHPDHFSDLIPLLFVWRRKREIDINIIGFTGLKKFIKNIFKIIPATEPKFYKINYTEMANSRISIDEIKIESKRLKHCKNSVGFRIETEGKIVAYSGDSDVCKNLATLSKDADLFICEATMPDELKYKGHLTSSEAGEIAQKSNVKKLVLTHLSPICGKYDIKSQAEKTFGGEVVIAEDLMTIKV
ncbi:MAG: MBL fold metallo-hydrolase [bacterium]